VTPDERRALREALAGRTRNLWNVPEARRAAVLVPLLVRESELRVILTLRSTGLRSHSGQWSFPGGSIDAGDADELAAALREAEEEIGLDPSAVEPIGLLDEVPAGSGFLITPVVAWVEPPPADYRPNPVEVAEVLEIALARLAAPGVLELGDEIHRFGRSLRMMSYQLDGRNIWGATARILAELIEALPAVH
jgi:8-oxo-dGTP pyrophosphatase MutT (NUDIX family)